MQSPILLVVFNRPDTTRQVFEAIRAARPPRLYVAADGPRPERPDEAEKCAEVRRLTTQIDWPCELKTLFRSNNLGCKLGVSSAIDWFFKNEPEGIILEDDIVPLPSFFLYCDELLEKYRYDHRIGIISGCNFVAQSISISESYFFSIYNHIWGWASWRRAWQHYDISMINWPAWKKGKGIKKYSNASKLFEAYWSNIFEKTHNDPSVTWWDYQWTFICWEKNMLSILPKSNQIINIGFGTDATHTTGEAPNFVMNSKPKIIDFPLVHPKKIEINNFADKLISKKVFGISTFLFIKIILSKAPILLNITRRIRNIVTLKTK
ncbi:glycosyltransferase family 2 protein [Cellvibrio sp.]|uniref:glycosyltransferase family 2 protein n=1 Tax=Cellvibrio sp. TaxID=1965322 RepID=UPI0039648948